MQHFAYKNNYNEGIFYLWVKSGIPDMIPEKTFIGYRPFDKLLLSIQ